MGLVYLPTFSWLIFTYFYGFHVGSIPFVPWMVWVPCSSEHAAEKIPRMRLPTTPWWRWGDLDFSSNFSNKKTWGPCGVLGPSMLEDGPVIFWMQQFLKWARYKGRFAFLESYSNQSVIIWVCWLAFKQRIHEFYIHTTQPRKCKQKDTKSTYLYQTWPRIYHLTVRTYTGICMHSLNLWQLIHYISL